MAFCPYLPDEIWEIIFEYKKKIEIRDDCIVDSKRMKLRSGKIIYKNDTRMHRFINKSSFILFSIKPNDNISKIEKLTDMILEDYIFIMDNLDLIKRNKIPVRLLNTIVNKIYTFRDILKYNPQNIIYKMKINDMNYCLFRLEKCIYFLEHYKCIKNNNNCDCGDMIMSCSDFKQLCS